MLPLSAPDEQQFKTVGQNRISVNQLFSGIVRILLLLQFQLNDLGSCMRPIEHCCR